MHDFVEKNCPRNINCFRPRTKTPFMRKLVSLMRVVPLLFLFALQANAQEVVITGSVRDLEKGEPLEGVTVRVAGKPTAVKTDAKGGFTIKASNGQVLQISYVGYEAQRVTVREGANYNVKMKSEASELDDVVVVAMDQKRKPRELGYSTQKLSGNEVQETQRENFLNSLQGRIAGATITPTSGVAGASSQIVLRGFNSMALDNSPLFVVDGIILDNQTVNESGGGASTGLASDRPNRDNDYTNRIADLNPNDIESITVLKGPEATALYGSQASSGAIVITTRKAKATGKLNVAYDNSFRFTSMTRFPEYSNKFSSGTNGVPENSFSYFGPEYAQGTRMFDNIDRFFQMGIAQTHNVGMDFGRKNYSFRFSGTYFDQTSVVPNNRLKRYNFRLSNTTKIGKKIEITPSIAYTNSANDKPLRGAGGYMLTLLQWPPTDDISDYLDASGNKNLLFGSNPNTEIDNPFFNVNFNRSRDNLERWVSTLGVNVNLFPWLLVTGRFGYDTYRQTGYTFRHPTSSLVTAGQGGQLDNYYRNYYGYNHTITATATKKLGNFNGRVMLGNMWQNLETQHYAIVGTNLLDSTSKDSSNTRANTRVRLNNARKGLPNYSINRQLAYFGEFSVNYKNMIFLTYTHRFETSSIFPEDFRNYNYPAGSLSFIMTDLLPFLKSGNVMNYWKLRGSLANTARSSAPYANQSVFNINTGSGGGFVYGFTNANDKLEPERQSTYELGTEMKFLNNKINLDVTYYNTKNTRQIVENFRASYGTGFVLNTLNVGSTQNEGVEVAIDATPVQTKKFRWNTRFNFNRMWNKVTGLPSNVPEFYISDTWLYGNARGGLVVGGPTTSITAVGYTRNAAGQILIDPLNGLPVIDPSTNFVVRGDRNPTFTLGWVNNFSYKNWRLNFLWDFRVGGDIYNGTSRFLHLIGRSRNQDDRMVPRIVDGVLNDGLQNTANPTRNTIVVNPYYNQGYYTARMPEEAFIEKGINWARLRDITLSYTFTPAELRQLSWIKSLSAFVTANDLILITNYTGADPAVNGNTAGTRGVGAAGFDFGNIPTPVSINMGFRATFK